MTALLILLTAQVLIGALDNLLHHEITEKLPSQVGARRELALHAARELIYMVVVTGRGCWLAMPGGLWAWALLALLLAEIVITTADFLEEDRTRTLPPFERVLHTVLAVTFGGCLAVGAPIWLVWAGRDTGLAVEPRGLFCYFFTLAAIGVGAWGVRDVIASARLFAKAHAIAHPSAAPSGRTLLITGGTGFLGEALTRRRITAGDAVVLLTRDPRRAGALFGGQALAVSDLDQIPSSLRLDGIVNLAGAGVAAAPWIKGRKRVLLASRLDITNALAALIARLDVKPPVLVSASAVGIYGDAGDHALTEHAHRGAGFTRDLCEAWEAAAVQAGAGGMRVVRPRFGLVLGRDGGAWPMMTLSLHLGLGAVFGSGRQWMAWIHKDDALRLVEAALFDERLSGPVNAVAPMETTHGEVIRCRGRCAGLQARLLVHARAWALRFGLGEMAHLFLDSQRVIPRAAGAAGFVFRYPTIEGAATDLLGGRTRSEAAWVLEESAG